MANEFKHKDPCSTLTQCEYIGADGTGHIFSCQATGDILYASSATVLKNLAKGAAGTILSMGGSCLPAWTATPTIGSTSWCNAGHAHAAANSGGTVCANVLAGTTLKSTVVTSSLTTVGALNSGTIACGFGAIDNGSSTITTTGLISGGSLDIDSVLINATTIGHTCDTDLLTIGNACLTIKGAVTVGVDDTGHDVKFFGAAAGAYMLYDQSCDQLEIRGASADATTSTGKLLLSTSLTNVNANDVIGSINFQAPAEAGGTDAVAVAAGIRAVAQATFTCAVNATDLIFYTGHSEAATEKFRFTSQNEIGIAGANYGTDGQVLTSGGAGAAVAWEDAAGGGSLILIGTQPATSCPSTLGVAGMGDTYDSYLVAFSDIQPNTNAAALVLRLGASGSIDDGASDYAHHSQSMSSASGSYSGCVDNSRDQISITPNGMGNTGGEGVQGHFWIHQAGDGANYPFVNGQMAGRDGSCVDRYGAFYGTRLSNIATAQVQLSLSSGTFKRGRLTVWGLANA